MFKSSDYLFQQILTKESLLCVGLDPDLAKIPPVYLKQENTYFNFCKDIIDASSEFAIAYKINIAFFEALGTEGWSQLVQLIQLIPKECLIIADAKRADIGNTSLQYADYYFNKLSVDALTLHPYMGVDSLQPFLNFKDKYSVILALTSNSGSADFEFIKSESGLFMYEHVISKFVSLEYSDNMMFVCGATHPAEFKKIRTICPNHFLLVPGVGEQGGDLRDTIRYGKTNKGGLLINVSRKICYPNLVVDFKTEVKAAARYYQTETFRYFKDQ